VNGGRAQGVTLYALAVLLLAAGAFWFFAAAPETGVDPEIAAGRVRAEELLPDLPLQAGAETMVLAAGVHAERWETVDSGPYVLAMLCVGEGQVRVWLGRSGAESGRAVRCDREAPGAVELTVGLAEEFHVMVSAETEGPAVFRWRVTPGRRF
jgi:hypothetical protein